MTVIAPGEIKTSQNNLSVKRGSRTSDPMPPTLEKPVCLPGFPDRSLTPGADSSPLKPSKGPEERSIRTNMAVDHTEKGFGKEKVSGKRSYSSNVPEIGS